MGYSNNSQKLFGMAIQIAEKCSHFYHVLEGSAHDANLKKTFSRLSLEGKDQAALFKKFDSSLFGSDVYRKLNIDNSCFYFALVSEAQKFSAAGDIENSNFDLQDEIGSIQLAVSFEKDSILFWEEIKNLTTGDLHQKIEKFIAKKKDRITKLLHIRMNLMKN